MAELDTDELWVLDVTFEGGTSPGDITRVLLHLHHLGFGGGQRVLDSLVAKKVLSLSPDGRKVRITDYGLEMYESVKASQQEWEAAPIVRVSNLERSQTVIRAGETFKANRVLREIFGQAKRELVIIDPWVGEGLFDLLEPFVSKLTSLQILTATNAPKTALLSYKAFHTQYPRCEMRTESGLHDRYILWDHAQGFHSGHSLKDLGTKDSQLNVLENPVQHWTTFDARWAKASTIP